jgi:hypothetical protein
MPRSDRVHVQIWASNYGGTTIGPIKAVYASVPVLPRRSCTEDGADKLFHMWWWWYYGDTAVNAEFKRDVWGIPNEQAAIEMLYLSPLKEARLLEGGNIALRLSCDTNDVVEKDPPHHVLFQTVAPNRPAGADENGIELTDYENVVKPRGAPGKFYYCAKGSTVDQRLSSVDFTPVSWTFCNGFNGIVKIYDDKGGGPAKKPQDQVTKVELTGDVVEEVRKGLQALNVVQPPRRRKKR